MLLHFNHKHLSIDAFDDVVLPDFTVLTGVNGSGKTQLLMAIAAGNCTISDVNEKSIVLFNYESFKLDNETAHSAHSLNEERNSVWIALDNQVRQNIANWTMNLKKDLPALQHAAKASGTSLWASKGHTVFQQYKDQLTAFLSQPHLQSQQWAPSLMRYATYAGTTLDNVTREEFMREYRPIRYKKDFLPQELGRIVWDYYIDWVENEVNKMQHRAGNRRFQFLEEADFMKEHGPKPWVLLNSILATFGSLDYRFESPEGFRIFDDYKLKLVHNLDPELKLDFDALSSGERVLMALVVSIYRASTDTTFPDLLLLDELDATLHPSMVKNLLSVLNDIFVARGTRVMLVTHSPTTIALSEESSLFVVNKRGRNRIAKASKADSLSILTEGFATLSEGMLLIDQAFEQKFSIISEGRNAQIIKEAVRHYSVSGVNVIEGLESATGKNQLKTLYEFMTKVPHKSKILFVWDCDVGSIPVDANNTYAYKFEKNEGNAIASKGIENLFPEALFAGYVKTITMSRGETKTEFDETRKRDFEGMILARNNRLDFSLFSDLVTRIEELNT